MRQIKIHEVGMRDGLQMESKVIPTSIKLEWIDRLINSNVDIIQIGSFVHKEKMPQMADTDELFTELIKKYKGYKHPIFSGLVLNEKGLERALSCGVEMICMGVSASETHSMKNTRMSVDEAATRIIAMAKEVINQNIKLQVSVQSAFGCGFEGDIAEGKVYSIIERYSEAGITSISLADTSGYANPEKVRRMFEKVHSIHSNIETTCHFHNTFGMGIANAYAAYISGVTSFESAFGGLGGCPFTKKAAGNIATEDLVEMFQNFGLTESIDLEALIDLSKNAQEVLEKELPGFVYKAGRVKH